MADLLAKLPPVPASLKSIAPYLQRAEELRIQDPIVAYWCAYYAAQVGINLRARDAASRDLLLALLSALEQIKNELGPNDAIHIESASSAYVENFAIKVFVNADNEDRSGHATRSTAKKFLAAANFLEVLNTFPKSDISESIEEKIRYAKWKAADIAKAFREGRKPAPGPPGWVEEQEELKSLQQQELEQQQGQQVPSAPTFELGDSESHLASDSIVAAAAPSFYEAHYDEHLSPSLNTDSSHLPSSSRPSNDEWAETGDYASEPWSTAAAFRTSDTPINLSANSTSVDWVAGNWSDNVTESSSDRGMRAKARSGSGSSSSTTELNEERSLPNNELHFSPSTISHQPPQPSPEPHFGSPTENRGSLSTHTSQPQVFPSSAPQIRRGFAKQSSPAIYSHSRSPPTHPIPVQEGPIELNFGVIAKARKHCRFAVSALDYDDIDQAKKELRAALALLEG